MISIIGKNTASVFPEPVGEDINKFVSLNKTTGIDFS
jgi:hypothetical protein